MGDRVETIVIGAGQAGLAVSHQLRELHREHVILERGSVAETWRSQRWDGFVLNTPNWAQQLPGFHYAGPDPDGFAPLAEVIGYLEAYADAIDAPVHTGVNVTRVRRPEGRFVVETSTGSFEAENVIVAAGAYQRPSARSFAQSGLAGVMALHTSEYRHPDQLPAGGVLIVGSGQSGCQIADELLTAGRDVYLSVGACPWLPRRYRGRELVHWLIETGLADETVDSLPSPAARLVCNPPVSGNDGGHDCNARWLEARGATLLGRVTGMNERTVRLGPGLAQSLRKGDEFVAMFQRRVDEYVRSSGLDVPEPAPEDPPASPPERAEIDLLPEGIGTIMWANGFRPDHSWIEGVETDEQGWPLQSRGVSPISGLYFVGLHWLHKRKSSLFFGVGADAEYVARRLDGGN